MNDENYTVAFEIITNAGNSKSASLMAIEAAREFDFEKATEYLEEAKESMHLAHDAHFDMIQNEANGNSVDVNIILVHAQDHLTMAIMANDYALEMIELYRMIQKLMKGEM